MPQITFFLKKKKSTFFFQTWEKWSINKWPLQFKKSHYLVFAFFSYAFQSIFPVTWLFQKSCEIAKSSVVCHILLMMKIGYPKVSDFLQSHERCWNWSQIYDSWFLPLKCFMSITVKNILTHIIQMIYIICIFEDTELKECLWFLNWFREVSWKGHAGISQTWNCSPWLTLIISWTVYTMRSFISR